MAPLPDIQTMEALVLNLMHVGAAGADRYESRQATTNANRAIALWQTTSSSTDD